MVGKSLANRQNEAVISRSLLTPTSAYLGSYDCGAFRALL